jgi:hypothetical protein
MAAEDIFGPDVGSLKGKTSRHSPKRVQGQAITVPPSIYTNYRGIILGADIMSINKLPFFTTISRQSKFCTAEMLHNQKASTLLAAIKQVKSVYKKRGFNLSQMFMDGQFETLRGKLASLQITLYITSNDEHIPEIERHHRTVKERIHSI